MDAAQPPSPSSASTDTTLTDLLLAWRRGQEGAAEALMPMVWGELHRLAKIHAGRDARTLQPTALVNEAYLKLAAGHGDFADRIHFFAFAARVMRSVMVDHLRAQQRQKRGGDHLRVTWDKALNVAQDDTSEDFLRLDDALKRLEAIDARKCRILELCYFSGLNYDDIAEALAISKATVGRELRLARAWLRAELAQNV